MEKVRKKSVFGESLNIPTSILPVEKDKVRIKKLFDELKLCEATALADNILSDFNDSDETNSFYNWFIKEQKAAEQNLNYKLNKFLDVNQIKEADELYKENSPHVDNELEQKFRLQSTEIAPLLKEFQFRQAETIWVNAGKPSANEYNRIKSDCLERFFNERLTPLVENYEFEEAEKLWIEAGKPFEREYLSILNKCQIDFYLRDFKELLKQFRFKEADDKWCDSKKLYCSNYELMKSKYISEYFSREYPHVLTDSEKVEALANITQNLLTTARAGSGKTRLLTCKAALLMDKYGIDPDKILLLAFNKKAAREMQNRIIKDFRIDNFRNARTFHSLAYKLVKPREKILYDQLDEDFAGDLSLFVKDVLRDIWNPVFRQTMLQLFKKEMAEIEKRGDLLEDADYYVFRRGMRDITLKGDRVKSMGEKFIADFLFEHDINYTYEAALFWNKDEIYRPDFTLYENQKDIVIEHWALDPESLSATLPYHWTKTADEYREEMQRKKEWLQWKGIHLIETSVADLKPNGGDVREDFEKIFRNKLEACGIKCQRLTDTEIADRVVKKQTSRMIRMFVQFIQKSKKKRWNSTDAAAQVEKHIPLDQREAEFLKLATKVYKEYENKIEKEDITDFDILMEQAVGLIKKTEGNCSIPLGRNRDCHIRMNELEWILIDEYQDFSRQFHDLTDAIIKTNSKVKLFCVGDDWQAINGFAGSDVSYFDNFEDNYLNAGRKSLLTNYRSHKAIVEAGNNLMRGWGEEAKACADKGGGTVEIIDVASKWIECDKTKELEFENDLKFRFYEKTEDGNLKFRDNGELQAKYVKTIFEIVTEPANFGKKEVAILSRTNNFYYLQDVKAIKQKLKHCFAEDNLLEKIGGSEGFDKLFRIGTAHSFKGLEADIVFILKACEGSFPLIHPDWTLYRIFGENEKTIFGEEKRLFYVALTRAREKVYCLTEKGRESCFLKNFPQACLWKQE